MDLDRVATLESKVKVTCPECGYQGEIDGRHWSPYRSKCPKCEMGKLVRSSLLGPLPKDEKPVQNNGKVYQDTSSETKTEISTKLKTKVEEKLLPPVPPRPDSKSRWQISQYYDDNNSQIIKEAKEIGEAATRERWKIPSGTWSQLVARWNIREIKGRGPYGIKRLPALPPIPPKPPSTDRWALGVYYGNNKEQILREISKFGKRAIMERWGISECGLIGLKARSAPLTQADRLIYKNGKPTESEINLEKVKMILISKDALKKYIEQLIENFKPGAGELYTDGVISGLRIVLRLVETTMGDFYIKG